MGKRIISATASELRAMGRADILEGIAASEGRVLACETIGVLPPMLWDVSNAELAASQGADLLLLNLFDVLHPAVNGLPPCAPEEVVRTLKRLTGRLIGINLEPAPTTAGDDSQWAMTEGRRATAENAVRAADLGVDLILLTGNPGMAVSNPGILAALRTLRAAVGDRVILGAGKMHAGGLLSEAGERIISAGDVRQFAEAAADVLLFPAPGTVPGITTEYVRRLIAETHDLGKLAMTAIGTSQEGADVDTIRRIALECKMAGTDIHHLGDAGGPGIALPENIFAYSVAIRGVRHTYHRQASSVNR